MYLEKLVIEGELWEVGYELYIDWQAKDIDDNFLLRDVIASTFPAQTSELAHKVSAYAYGKMRITIEKLEA